MYKNTIFIVILCNCMKIIDIKINRNPAKYSLVLDNGEIVVVHIDIVNKFYLSKDTFILDDKFNEIVQEQAYIEALQYSIGRLAIKKYSIFKFTQKLKEKKFSDDIINKVIARLIELNLLDDDFFAKIFTQHLVNVKKYGQNRVKLELQKQKIDNLIIDKYVANIELSESELDKLVMLCKKKLNSRKNKTIDKQKNYLLGFLKNKGYDYTIAKKVIDICFSDK